MVKLLNEEFAELVKAQNELETLKHAIRSSLKVYSYNKKVGIDDDDLLKALRLIDPKFKEIEAEVMKEYEEKGDE